MSSNGFTGTLPTTLGDMRRLRYLFTNAIPGLEPGRMPSFLQDLTNLRELGMKGNSLTGQFPNWIHFLKNLKHLDLRKYIMEMHNLTRSKSKYDLSLELLTMTPFSPRIMRR